MNNDELGGFASANGLDLNVLIMALRDAARYRTLIGLASTIDLENILYIDFDDCETDKDVYIAVADHLDGIINHKPRV